MKVSSGLILKGAAGGAAATAATTAAVYGENIYSLFITGSFEIVDETEKFDSLRLPGAEECKRPDRYDGKPVVCDLDTNKLKNINFYENGATTVSTVTGDGNFTLTIYRLWGNEIFDRGYRFILKSKDESNDVTISLGSGFSIYLGKDRDFEFKIKEVGEKWYLERAWDEKTIREKIGLECQTNNICSLGGKRKINVMIGGDKLEGINGLSGGKIKLHKNTKDYQQGLKFTIEESDIGLNGGRGATTIKKFERDETYEIKRDGDEWYLSRKTSAIDAINENLKGLGLPDNCKMGENGRAEGCDEIKTTGLQKINFHERGGATLTVTNADKVTLKLERTNNRDDYPGGVKIIFANTEEVTIRKNGDSNNFINWKAETNTEYKIKNPGGSKTLEKAWTLVNLAYEVGMTGCSGSDKCTITKSLKVQDGNKKADKLNVASSASELKSLKYAEGQAGYNQGFKFTAEENISLSGGAISKLKKGATYEIRELNWKGKKEWFLVKKTLSEDEKKIIEKVNQKIKDVGIDKEGCKFKGDEETLTCQLSETELNAVKFQGKGSQGLTVSPSASNFNLKISRVLEEESPKLFTFKSPSGVKTATSQTVIFENGVDAKFEIKVNGTDSTLKKIVEQAQK